MWLELEEKEKEKALKVSWAVAMYSVATAVGRLERKMTASPPPRLPFRGKNLMEKPEGVKFVMICSSPVSVNQVSVRNKISKCSSSISSCSSLTLFLHDRILSSPIFRSMGRSTQRILVKFFALTPLLCKAYVFREAWLQITLMLLNLWFTQLLTEKCEWFPTPMCDLFQDGADGHIRCIACQTDWTVSARMD